MEINLPHRPALEHPDRPRAGQALDSVKRSSTAFGVLSAAALLAVIVVASTGHPVTTFMWVRAILLPAVAVLTVRMTVAASRGSQRAENRLSAILVILPIAIIGVDLVPGVCPLWYAGMQAVCMLPVIRAAFVTHGRARLRRQ